MRKQIPNSQALIPSELQILPGLALLTGRAQQVGRMIRDDERRAARREFVHLPAQPRKRRARCEQTLRGNAADGQNELWLDRGDLAQQKRPAGGKLLGLRIAITGRAALEHVGDENVLRARQADRLQHRIQELARGADERLALTVLLRAGRLADHEPIRVRVANAEYGAGARVMQRALSAHRHLRLQRLPIGAQRGRVRRHCGRDCRAARHERIDAERIEVLKAATRLHYCAPAGGPAEGAARFRRRTRRPTHKIGADSA